MNMATIMTSIELQDRFSTIVYGMINAVNLSLSAIYDMREAVSADINTASLEGAKEEIDNATLAARQLQEAMQAVGKTRINMIQQPVMQPERSARQQPMSQGDISNEPFFKEQPVLAGPIKVPVEWKTDVLPVFTETGIERFTQEVQNAVWMMEQLAGVQTAIVQQAKNISIFPLAAQEDLTRISARIEVIRGQISMMEQNPVNIGTNSANMGMECLRNQMSIALREQKALNQAVGSMDVEGANKAYLRLSETIADTERYIRGNKDVQREFNQTVNQGKNYADNLMQCIKRIATAYISMQGLRKAIDISDQLASTQAKLDMMNDGMRTTRQLQDMIFASTESSRGSYLDMANSVAKLGSLAKDAFSSTEEVVAFSEQLNKQFVLAGASTTEIQNATLQLAQALASGALRGDELNNIFEHAPTIIQSIADYMDVPIGQISELASEGQITADIVKNAMFMAADKTNAKFESMPKTFEQIGQSIQNQAIMVFNPVFTRLNELANSEKFQEMVEHLIQALSVLANITVYVLELMILTGSFVADSWSVLGPIIAGVAAELLIYYGVQMALKGIEKINYGLHILQGAALMMKAAAMGTLNKETAKQIAEQLELNAAMYACPVMWIIMLVVALITVVAVLISVMNDFGDESTSAIEKICGAFAVAVAFIGNLFILVINFIIDDFVNLWNFIALFANFLANVFTDPLGAAARLFAGFIDLALAGLQGLAAAIDMLFGSSLAESVAGWRTDLDNWVTAKFGEGKIVMEKKNAQDYYMQGFDYEEAWNKGAEFGGKFGGSADMPWYEDFDYSSYLTDISDNTEDIRDGMEISEEDLRYLRDIAEQETINRFTTAAITIEQTNHNNVSGGMDLDGVITGLTDAVSEAAGIITEGVH